MEIRHRVASLYLLAVLPLAYLGIRYRWATTQPSGSLPTAFESVIVLSVLSFIGIGALSEIARTEHRPFGSWPFIAVAIPLLVAIGATLNFYLSRAFFDQLAWIGYTLFWFASAIYVVTVVQFGFWFLWSPEES